MKLQWKLDRTGFPMLWVDSIQAYMHWMPATKIQFENFLGATSDSRFDATWYDEILAVNERITPDAIRLHNYWKAFLSGVRPSEVENFARWQGEGYAIPTIQDWFTAYKSLKASPPVSSPLEPIEGLRPRIKTLLSRLDAATNSALKEAGYERTLADQMVMRMGVMEWVAIQNQRSRWGGMGETYPPFHGALFTPDHGQPSVPNNPEGERLRHYGFRLIWRSL